MWVCSFPVYVPDNNDAADCRDHVDDSNGNDGVRALSASE
jgi:hypothetical protein